jgi:hypothetical protein
MLHAGIGLAFAQALLAPVTPGNSATALGPALRTFVRLCRENSRPGYVGAAYESLGLVAQTYHPDLVAEIDRWLPQTAGGLLGFFWHGVGRALYFSPRNFLPCSDIDWTRAPASAPHETGRLNVIAGLAWAVTLVNMRQPTVIERLLRRQGNLLASSPAFANGVASSVVVRASTTPGAGFTSSFCSHRPEAAAGDLTTAWDRLVAGPCHDALVREQPLLARAGRLDTVFEYRSRHDPPSQGYYETPDIPDD